MIGTIVNRYSKQIAQVEIAAVESIVDGRSYLVNKREFEGGKVHLNIFDEDTHKKTSDMIWRHELAQVAGFRSVFMWHAAANEPRDSSRL